MLALRGALLPEESDDQVGSDFFFAQMALLLIGRVALLDFFFSNGKNPQTFATSTCFIRLQGWSLDSVSKEWMPMGSLDEATDFLVEAQREANCQKVFGGQ